MRCQFDGSLDVRRGEIVKITTAISDTDPLRVSVIENVTSGKRQVSRIEGVMMVKPPVKLTEPIFGRVKSSQVDQYNTYFEIEEISPKDTESKEEHRDLQLAQDIQVFICYAKEDREKALKLYIELKKEDDMNPWIDEESLLPGQNWRIAISNAIRDSRYFVALLSSNSVNKKGYGQRELKEALDILDEYPQSQVYIIPVRLDNCQVSDSRLKQIQYVDLFPDWEKGFRKILSTIQQAGSLNNTSCD